MNPSHLNYPAIVVAALSGFTLGGLWYSPLLFANAWLKGAGLNNEEVQKGNKAKIFGSTFVLFLIMAFILPCLLIVIMPMRAGVPGLAFMPVCLRLVL